jgi:gamma-glutamylcyclotransferase (GGCT)/AIG2-like uncharacterized protein YtfP
MRQYLVEFSFVPSSYEVTQVMATLFGYGTLSIPEIVKCLTGGTLPTVPGTARGYARYRMKGRTYPGIIADPRGYTDGVLYEDLDAKMLEIFHAFEDDVYETRVVSVATSTHIVQAIAYVVPPGNRQLLSKDSWDAPHFMEQHGKRYLRMCRKFRDCFAKDYPDLGASKDHPENRREFPISDFRSRF